MDYEYEINRIKNDIDNLNQEIKKAENSIKDLKEKIENNKNLISRKNSELIKLQKEYIEDFKLDYKLPLSEDDKTALRNIIIEKTNGLKDEQKIRVDVNLLDELIFFKDTDENGIFKVPIWTGSFLKKIELKDLSFANVVFGIPEEAKNMVISNDSNYDIDLSETDVKIDFSKTRAKGILFGCNFKGVDLSKSNGNLIRQAYHCNFSRSKIQLGLDEPNREITMVKCNLSMNDMNGLELDAQNLNLKGNKINLYKCNLVGTKIKFKFKKPEDMLFGEFATCLKAGVLHECYMNYEYIDNRKMGDVSAVGFFKPEFIEFDENNKIIDGSVRKNNETENIGGFGSK